MPTQTISARRSRPISQIPAVQTDDGTARTALGLARIFERLADQAADREDRLAVTRAKREGREAGAAGAGGGGFERRDEATLAGEAFNQTAQQTFLQTLDAKAKSTFRRLETAHASNAPAYNEAVKGYVAGVLSEVEASTPELVPLIEAELDTLRQAGEARIVKTMADATQDRAEGSALRLNRTLLEDLTTNSKFLDLSDVDSTTQWVSMFVKERAKLRLALSAANPINGLPMFSDVERTKMLQEFDDRATEAAIVGAFDNMLIAEQRGDTTVDTVSLLDAFEAGETFAFRINGLDGEETVHRLAIHDELRKKIVTRMRASMSAANSQIKFAQDQADRALEKWNRDRVRDIYQSSTPAEFALRLGRYGADPKVDPAELARATNASSWIAFNEADVKVDSVVDQAKLDVLTGEARTIHDIDQLHDTGLGPEGRLEIAQLIEAQNREDFFTNSLAFKAAERLIQSTVAPNIVAGAINLSIGASESEQARSDFNRLRAELTLATWDAQRAGQLPEDINAPPEPGQFDIRAKAEQLIADWKAGQASKDSEVTKLRADLEQLRSALEAGGTRQQVEKWKNRITAKENRLRELGQEVDR